MKSRFPGKFHDYLLSDGMESITLTVTRDGRQYSERHTVPQGKGITAAALKHFHAWGKQQGLAKCEVTFTEKVVPVDVPDLDLSVVDDILLEVDDDWF